MIDNKVNFEDDDFLRTVREDDGTEPYAEVESKDPEKVKEDEDFLRTLREDEVVKPPEEKEEKKEPVKKDDDGKVYTIEIEDGIAVNIGSSSVIGKRADQQDAIKCDDYYSYLKNGQAIAVLCDGMGGLSGGALASGECTSLFYNVFHGGNKVTSIPNFLYSIARAADKHVAGLKNDKGINLKAGTTLVCAVIDGSDLYFMSVGDSKLYFIRDNVIQCLTVEHNYHMLLQKKVDSGKLSQAEADNDPHREALVSYIGVDGFEYFDLTNNPIRLKSGDKIVICSDGLYRTLTEQQIMDVVLNCDDTQRAAEELTGLALCANKPHQDNTSVIVISYDENGSYNI